MVGQTRRDILRASGIFAVPPIFTLLSGCQQEETESEGGSEATENQKSSENPVTEDSSMQVYYLEIVTTEVEALCRQYAQVHGVEFSEANPAFGGARTAELDGGGLLGIRAPLRESETPVIRPYLLVDDIAAGVKAAAEAGAQIAMPPTPLPGHGQFAIVIHGGIDCGLWQNDTTEEG